jgi:hypothetical protein
MGTHGQITKTEGDHEMKTKKDRKLPYGEHIWLKELRCWARLVRDTKEDEIEQAKVKVLERLTRGRLSNATTN